MLSGRAHREADGLISLYTESFGLIRAVAPGVKKPGAKLAGHLEPLSISEVTFIQTEGGWRLIGAVLEEPFRRMNHALERKRLALGGPPS